jgi:hypothetical protein
VDHATEKTVKEHRRAEEPQPARLPSVWLVFDCETTTDETQRLTFGACRIYEDGRLISEILFSADDLPERDPDGFAILQRYVQTHHSDAMSELGVSRKPLRLMSCTEFLEEVFFPVAYEGHAVVVGFNLPFDLTRIARKATPTKQGDGFSLQLWEHPMRTRLQIRIRDNKRADIRFTKRRPYPGESSADASFRGHFLDCRTLAFALTDRGYSLATAGKAFDSSPRKIEVESHGEITSAYIDYCRNDVAATWGLTLKLRERFGRHPIPVLPTQVRSGAGVSKGYLAAAKIPPILERDPSFDRHRLGQAMVAYYGGRSECHIRLWPVPVVYFDFTSMYTTVNSLIGVWDCLIAEELTFEDVTAEAQAFLRHVTTESMLLPENWKGLIIFVELEPDGTDILPVRALYQPRGAYQIGVNSFESSRPLWYTYADAIASKLHSGKAPKVLRAWRLVPHGVRHDLQAVLLNGEIPLDPAKHDLNRVVIEERNRLPDKKSPTGTFLKVVANSAYGINVEMNPERLGAGERAEVDVHGLSNFRTKVARPEKPGRYCFPPLGAAITGSARLMLTLLECLVRDAGGTYAFCDTDSMAIVATGQGGQQACPGGPLRMPDGTEAIGVLSWAEVEAIRQRFSVLNPYARDAVPDSILKIEDVNFEKGKQRQLYALVISTKRYVIHTLSENGEPLIVDAKAHGLGHLLPPDGSRVSTDAADDEKKLKPWMRELWLMLVREALGLQVTEPAWFDRPAMSRITVSQPVLLKLFADYNAGKPYADQIKPCNFLIAPHVARFGHPVGADRTHFALFAPFTSKDDARLELEYIERYSGKRYRISTSIPMGTEDTVRVQTCRDVFIEYRTHPEAKFDGPDGKLCGRNTIGLLSRRHVRLGELHFVGKESNELEAREYGQTADLDEVQTEYIDARDRHRARAAEVEAQIEVKGIAGAASAFGVSERTLRRWRGERGPSA